MSTESGIPVTTVDVEKPLIERIRILEADNQSLRRQVQVMAVELNVMANWIKQNGGVQLFNEKSEVYKNCHPNDERSAEIEKHLAVPSAVSVPLVGTVTSTPAPDLVNPAPLLIPKLEPGLDILFEEISTWEEAWDPATATATEDNQMPISSIRAEPVPVMRTKLTPPEVLNSVIKTDKQGPFLWNGPRHVNQPFDPISLTASSSKMDVRKGKVGRVPSPTKKIKRKPHLCNLCPMTFRKPSELKLHMLTHSKEKPHVCPVCDARFRQNSSLKRHMVTHTKDRPHKCNVCSQRFSRLDHLKSHQKRKSVHIGLGLGPLKVGQHRNRQLTTKNSLLSLN